MSRGYDLARLVRTGAPTFETAQDARDMVVYHGSPPAYIRTAGALSAGDGGGQEWWWGEASEEDDNTGTVLMLTGWVGAGRYLALPSASVDARAYGAIGDGSTDDTVAIDAVMTDLAAAGGGEVVFVGHFVYAGNMTVPRGVTLRGQSVSRFLDGVVGAESTAPSRIDLTGTGNGIVFEGATNLSADRGYGSRISDLLIYAGPGITTAVQFKNVEFNWGAENLFITVDAAATTCIAIDINNSWRGNLKNVYCYHAARTTYLSTAAAFRIYNEPNEDFNAINQITFDNIRSQFFGYGVQIVGGKNINSLNFIGGAAEYSVINGLSGVGDIQAISFEGFHIENTQTGAAFSLVADANGAPRNISYESAKMTDDLEGCFYFEGAINVTLQHVLGSSCAAVSTNQGAAIKLGAGVSGLRVSDCQFAPTSGRTGLDTAIHVDSSLSLLSGLYMDSHTVFAGLGTGTFSADLAQPNKWHRERARAFSQVTSGTAISVGGSSDTCVLVSHTTPTTVTSLTNGGSGQVAYLIFTSPNTTIQNGSGTDLIRLAGGVDFSPTANDTLTLVYTGTQWVELARSVN